MIIHCYNEHHPYLLFIDLEFDNRDLIQFAGLLFKEIDDEVYQIYRSINQYRNPEERVCYPFVEYTGITPTFLQQNGVPLKDLQLLVTEDFLKGVDLKDLEVISHGLRNDRLILTENGINLSNYTDKEGKVHPIDGYCTYNNAKRILKRNKDLKESDLAIDSGYYLSESTAHNAFFDVQAEVSVFTYLKKIERQQIDEREIL